MALLQPDETIIPIINICRKLEGCNRLQFETWVTHISKSFIQHNADRILIKIFKKALCENPLPSGLYNDILKTSPDESELNIDDSITKSDPEPTDEDSNAQPITFLQIAKDLKMKIFHYLPEYELKDVQRTCRCLAIAARDPNSLYHVNYWVNASYNKDRHNYLRPWYSRVRSLHISISNNCSTKYINPQWYNTVNILKISNKLNVINWFNGCFLNVSKLTCYFAGMSKNDSKSVTAVLQQTSHINFKSIQHLELIKYPLDDRVLFALMNCTNVETLTLFPWYIDTINDTTIQLLKNIVTDERKLKYVNLSGSVCKVYVLYKWILSNSLDAVNITINLNELYGEIRGTKSKEKCIREGINGVVDAIWNETKTRNELFQTWMNIIGYWDYKYFGTNFTNFLKNDDRFEIIDFSTTGEYTPTNFKVCLVEGYDKNKQDQKEGRMVAIKMMVHIDKFFKSWSLLSEDDMKRYQLKQINIKLILTYTLEELKEYFYPVIQQYFQQRIYAIHNAHPLIKITFVND